MLFQISSSRHFPSYISWKVSSATSAVDHINIPTYPIGQPTRQSKIQHLYYFVKKYRWFSQEDNVDFPGPVARTSKGAATTRGANGSKSFTTFYHQNWMVYDWKPCHGSMGQNSIQTSAPQMASPLLVTHFWGNTTLTIYFPVFFLVGATRSATRTIQVILRHQKEGFPSTAIREIRALRALQNHPNVAWAAPAAFDGVDAYGICMDMYDLCQTWGWVKTVKTYEIMLCYHALLEMNITFFQLFWYLNPWFSQGDATQETTRQMPWISS